MPEKNFWEDSMRHDERDVETLCEVMHDAYEAAATREGWETQERSRKPWADVPEANKSTMRAAVRAVLDALDVPGRERRAKAEALREFAGVIETLAGFTEKGGDADGAGLLQATARDMRNHASKIESEEADHE